MSRTVKALSLGFYAGKRYRPGDVFQIADKVKLGKWMQEVTVAKSAKPTVAETPASTAEDDNKPLGDKPLEEMKYNELLAHAKALGLAFESNPKKDDLVAAIKDAEKALPSSLV